MKTDLHISLNIFQIQCQFSVKVGQERKNDLKRGKRIFYGEEIFSFIDATKGLA